MAEIKPLYLFYGAERFLIERDLKFFRRHFSADGGFGVQEMDGGKVSLAAVVDAARTPPFFAERALVIVDHAPWFKEESKDSAALLDYIENPADFTCLVFVADEVDKRRKLFKAMLANGKARAYEPPNRWEMARYVRELFQKQGKRIDNAGMDLLLSLLPEELAVVHSEAEKIITYLGADSAADAATVLRLVAKSQEATNFQLSDALGSRDLKTLTPILKEVISQLPRDKEMALHGYIANYLRLLLRAREMMAKGKAVNGKSLGVHDFRAKKAAEAAAHYTEAELIQGLRRLSDVDFRLKSGQATFGEDFFTALLAFAKG